MKKLFAVLFLSSLALAQNGHSVNSGLPMGKPEEAGMSSERLDRIKTAMQRYVERRDVAGTVTLVARRGKVVHFDAVGFRDAEAKAPMTTDTIFRMASMTKPIASVALMMLYEQGYFLLNDPVSKWIPEFKDMKLAVAAAADNSGVPYRTIPAARPITIKNLLNHTSGLPNTYRGFTKPEFDKAVVRQNPNETMADVIARVSKLPLNFQPGEAWEYGPATDVVGRLVEIMSGMPFDEYLRKRIFEPLKMTDTYFYLPVEKVGRFAATYRPGPDNKIVLEEAPTAQSRYVREPHVYFSGAGGLVSTAADYVRFQQMMLNGGVLEGTRILGRKTVELMTSNTTGDLPLWLPGPGYGFGLGYSVVKDIGQTGLVGSPGQFGWGGAFCTYFWVDPTEETIGIMLAQLRPYTHVNIRQEFQVLANQAIVDARKRN